jgi:hypothetical protein
VRHEPNKNGGIGAKLRRVGGRRVRAPSIQPFTLETHTSFSNSSDKANAEVSRDKSAYSGLAQELEEREDSQISVLSSVSSNRESEVARFKSRKLNLLPRLSKVAESSRSGILMKRLSLMMILR